MQLALIVAQLTYSRSVFAKHLVVSSSQSLLLVSPAWLGDIVIAQALFRYLKIQRPQVKLDIIAPAWSHGLVKRMPEIDHILDLPFGHGQLALKKRWHVGRSLRKKSYQQAIVLPNSWKSALIPWAAQIPCRVGWQGEMRFGVLTHQKKLNKTIFPLMIQRFLALGTLPIGHQAISNWEIYQPRLHPDSISAQKTHQRWPFLKRPIRRLILCPGAAFGSAKQWPNHYFAEIIRVKHNEGWQVILLGAQHDRRVGEQIQQQSGQVAFNLIGQTTLSEALDILSAATLVISNDSGLMHCAAALQKPLIVIYGASSPRFTPPLTEHAIILSTALACQPCFQRECAFGHVDCLTKITPKQVLQAIHALID